VAKSKGKRKKEAKVEETDEMTKPAEEEQSRLPNDSMLSTRELDSGYVADAEPATEPEVAPEPEPEPPARHASRECPERRGDGEFSADQLDMLAVPYCGLCDPAAPVSCPPRPVEPLAQVVVRLDCEPSIVGVRTADGKVRPTAKIGELPPSVAALVYDLVAELAKVPGACGCASLPEHPDKVDGHHPDCYLVAE